MLLRYNDDHSPSLPKHRGRQGIIAVNVCWAAALQNDTSDLTEDRKLTQDATPHNTRPDRITRTKYLINVMS